MSYSPFQTPTFGSGPDSLRGARGLRSLAAFWRSLNRLCLSAFVWSLSRYLMKLRTMYPPLIRTNLRPSNSCERLSGSGFPKTLRASTPSSDGTRERPIIPGPAAATNPYHPGGTTKPVSRRLSTSNCGAGSSSSNGIAIMRAVTNTSRTPLSIQSDEFIIAVSSLTYAIIFPLECIVTRYTVTVTRYITQALSIKHLTTPQPPFFQEGGPDLGEAA